MKKQMKLIVIILSLGILIALALLFFHCRNLSHHHEGVDTMNMRLRMLTTVLSLYRAEFNDYPHGSNEQIARALAGENPKKMQYLSEEKQFGNDLHDIFGTPIKIEYKNDLFHLWSAGPNRIWGDSDDYHFCQLCGLRGQATIHINR
ncbi:MAG: hypothetical protein NTX50_15200 [Candidatus Sumerlaeota bacterium]|nr:hypothetical protein [Candidatus Sumerlaeota bacterium]